MLMRFSWIYNNTSKHLWSTCYMPGSNLLMCITSFNSLHALMRWVPLSSHLQMGEQSPSETKEPSSAAPQPAGDKAGCKPPQVWLGAQDPKLCTHIPVREGPRSHLTLPVFQSPVWTRPRHGLSGQDWECVCVKGQPLCLASCCHAVMRVWCCQIFLFFKRRQKARFCKNWEWGKRGITEGFSQRDWEEYGNNNCDGLLRKEEV